MPVCPKHSCRDARSTMVSERDFHIVPTKDRLMVESTSNEGDDGHGSEQRNSVSFQGRPCLLLLGDAIGRSGHGHADTPPRALIGKIGALLWGGTETVCFSAVKQNILFVVNWRFWVGVEFDCWIEQPVNSFTESFSEFTRSQTSTSLSASMGRRAILESGDGSRAGFVSVS